MPPRARRVHPKPKAKSDQSSAEGENISPPDATNDLQTRRKRTIASTQPSESSSAAPAATQEPPQKKTRMTGPAQSRPLQLNLMSVGNGGAQQGPLTAIDNADGKGKENNSSLERTSSFYPGRNRTLPTIASNRIRFEKDWSEPVETDGSDGHVETEEDWFDEPQQAERPQKGAPKTSEVSANERPVWQGSANPVRASASVGSLPSTTSAAPTEVATAQDTGSSASIPDTSVASDQSQDTWPSDTHLILFPGTNKIMLTLQTPLMRTIFQEAFDRLRVALVFIHAFPDLTLSLSMISEALVSAAEIHSPRASNIHHRLLADSEYMSKMSRLPRARIPLFRGEVKERCAAIVHVSFSSIGSVSDMVELVRKQLSNYLYTFPTALNRDPLHALPLRTKPYRNIRIITVIRDLFFSGGTTSFAHLFQEHFPTFKGEDGTMRREVPIPMVALVATALYAAIHEWRTGRHQAMEFSSNAYIDVYQGHVDTFHHIRDRRPMAFHVMMNDIYVQASIVDGTSGIPIAELDLEEIE